jgi:hypothetical protein
MASEVVIALAVALEHSVTGGANTEAGEPFVAWVVALGVVQIRVRSRQHFLGNGEDFAQCRCGVWGGFQLVFYDLREDIVRFFFGIFEWASRACVVNAASDRQMRSGVAYGALKPPVSIKSSLAGGKKTHSLGNGNSGPTPATAPAPAPTPTTTPAPAPAPGAAWTRGAPAPAPGAAWTRRAAAARPDYCVLFVITIGFVLEGQTGRANASDSRFRPRPAALDGEAWRTRGGQWRWRPVGVVVITVVSVVGGGLLEVAGAVRRLS